MLAWISVHDHVIGGKLRELSKEMECSQKEALGILVSMWIWGINNADKSGKLKSCDRGDVADVLSVGLSKSLDPDRIVVGLIEQHWLDEEPDGTLYLHDWDVWQEQWYKFLSAKEYDAKRKRDARAKTKENVDNNPEEDASADTPPESPEDSPADSPPDKKTSPYAKEFEEFWKVYPRKIGKGEVYKKYKARLNDGFSESELLVAAQNYGAQCLREKTEDKYIKHGKTFLSENTPFTDYIPKVNDKQPELSGGDGSNPFAAWKEDE